MSTLTEAADSLRRLHGCHNREPFKAGFWVAGYSCREVAAGRPMIVEAKQYIPNAMSTECQHDSANDQSCTGCRWQRA